MKLSQLRAMFAKLKLARKGVSSGTRYLSRSAIKVAGKNIPFVVSRGADKDKYMFFMRPGAIRSYLQSVPAQHINESNLKGIYILDEREFSRVMVGMGQRTSGIEATEAYGRQVVAGKKQSKSTQLLGVHHNGRIFMNVSGFRRYAEDAKSTLQLNPVKMMAFTQNQARSYFLHEFGHSVDARKSKLLVGVGAVSQVDPTIYKKSLSSEFMKALGASSSALTEGSLEEIAAAKAWGIETFANYYSQYATNPRIFKDVLPGVYDFMRKLFES